MACTLSNRETFLVLEWLQSDPERIARLSQRAQRLTVWGLESAIPRMSSAIYEELSATLPSLEGPTAAMLESGLRRVNFFELALAVLSEHNVTPIGVDA